MQEVFVKLMENQERLEGKYPSSLLYRIATNVCLNKIRANQYRKTSDQPEILERIASYDKGEEQFMARNLLDHLFKREKPSTREILCLHYVDGMTLQRVANEVGLSLSGVRKRIREFSKRARQGGVR